MHIVLLCAVTAVLIWAGVFPVELLSPASLNQWDADWFYKISQEGYSFDPKQPSSVAFFPLFPYWWKWTHVGWTGICILNFILFAGSVITYFQLYRPEQKTMIAFLCTPLLLYFFVPYSESVFFFSSVVLMIGIRKDNPAFISTGLFLSMFTRYAALIFLPAILIVLWWQWKQKKVSTKKAVWSGVLYSIVLLLALFLVSWIQYKDTGVWTGYAQTHIHWKHYFRLPELPFYSAMGSYMVLLDQLALLAGIISGGIIIYVVIQQLRRKKIEMESDTMFALLYLSGVTASIIFFQGGSLDSLSRYVFGTFFFYFLIKYVSALFDEEISLRVILYIVCTLLLFFAFCGSLNSLKYFIIYSMLALNIASLFVIFSANLTSWWGKTLSCLLYLAFLGLQAGLLLAYLRGEWIA